MKRHLVTSLLIVAFSIYNPASGQSTPSLAPRSIVPTVTLTCNICGDGNFIGAPDAIITFIDHAFAQQSMPCADLQTEANAADTPYPSSFCPNLQGFALGVCECTMTNGTVLTAFPTMAPTPRVTTLKPSFPPGAIPLTPTLSPVVISPTLPPNSTCYLCGVGNTIGSPDSSFTFTDSEGQRRTLGCSQAQQLLDTGSAPAGWCELVQEAAVDSCACTLPDGTPAFGSGPTVSPNNRDCWICGKTDGEANIIGDGNAVVDYIDVDGVLRKFPCKELARLASDTIAIPLSYCNETISQAIDPCRCATPQGDLLSDLYPTFSPVNGGKPATPAYKPDDDSAGSPTRGGGDDDQASPSSAANTDDASNSTVGGGGGQSDARQVWNIVQSAVIVGFVTLITLCI